MRAVLTARAGPTCEISWMSRPVRFRAANVSGGFFPYRQRSRSLGGSELMAKIADESGIP